MSRLKRGSLQFLQNLAASVFIGIAVYGAIIYWGGETNQKVPMWESLSLGALAVICVWVLVYIGGVQDRMAARKDKE
ncbi:MAG: hypothetical protein P1S46_00050 [bacterium]|nr:hypothetical protein [bacterium]MDT8396212.1 hypothetical protein [bacterium]